MGLGGTEYAGTFSSVQAWALGDATGSNPAGSGRAVWRGVAEAASTVTFERLEGVATVTSRSSPGTGPRHKRRGASIKIPGALNKEAPSNTCRS